jgi:hypothetical protein
MPHGMDDDRAADVAERVEMILCSHKHLDFLHAFESQPPFSAATLRRIEQLKDVYGMDYGVSAAHQFPVDLLAEDGQ